MFTWKMEGIFQYFVEFISQFSEKYLKVLYRHRIYVLEFVLSNCHLIVYMIEILN